MNTRDFITVVVVPALCGTLAAHGIENGDPVTVWGSISLVLWHLYLWLTEARRD